MSKEPTVSKVETLTEQWRNGTLKEGWYYYKTSDGRNGIATEYGLYCVEADNNVELEVLDTVPSYFKSAKLYVENRDLKEENKNLHNLKNELLEKIEGLTTKCNQLAKKVKKRGMQINRAYDRYVAKRKENSELMRKIHNQTSLKNILTECKEYLEREQKIIEHWDFDLKKAREVVLIKINEALR